MRLLFPYHQSGFIFQGVRQSTFSNDQTCFPQIEKNLTSQEGKGKKWETRGSLPDQKFMTTRLLGRTPWYFHTRLPCLIKVNSVGLVHPEVRGRELGWEPRQREKRANLGSDPLLRSDWTRGQGRHKHCCLGLSAWFTWMAPPSTRLPRLTSGPRLWLLAVDTRPWGQSQGSPQHTHGRLRADGGLLHH